VCETDTFSSVSESLAGVVRPKGSEAGGNNTSFSVSESPSGVQDWHLDSKSLKTEVSGLKMYYRRQDLTYSVLG
jgi:hypothetical protein